MFYENLEILFYWVVGFIVFVIICWLESYIVKFLVFVEYVEVIGEKFWLIV